MFNEKILFVLFVLLCISLPAQTLKLNGNVSTSTMPVKYASVTFIDESDTDRYFSALTDDLGNYELDIITTIEPVDIFPTEFELAQNYPNPFSSETVIAYKLNKPSEVSAKIYDILGREIKKFETGYRENGIHKLVWDGKNNFGEKITKGIYLYRVQVGNEIKVKKMIYGLNGKILAKTGSPVFRNNYYQTREIDLHSYRVEIKNTESTYPKIIKTTTDGVNISDNATFNYLVESENFAIYFLRDSTIRMSDILDVDIAELELADNPWLTQADIDFYDWSNHCIYLKKDKGYFFPNYKKYYQFPFSWTDRPWIVVANNIPYYKGYFSTDASTLIFPAPEMSSLEVGNYPIDIITSAWIFWFFHSDPRDNDNVKETLVQNGLYRGGIEVTIDTLNLPIRVFNGEKTAVEYTLIIKNIDQDDLFIFDPEKVLGYYYHYYTNGPNFINIETYQSYGSQYEESRKPEEWDSNWYTLLRSGEQITRTISNDGYPHIPPGEYLVQCGFSSPRLEKSIRENEYGRYWMGQLLTDTVRIVISE